MTIGAVFFMLLFALPCYAQAANPTVPFVIEDRAHQIAGFWTPTIRQASVDAVNEAMDQFGSAWHLEGHVYLDSQPHPSHTIPIVIDDQKDGGNDGIHLNRGVIRVHVRNCFVDEVPVSVNMSHEVEEFLIDPMGVTAVNAPFGLILTEVADPVNDLSYVASNGLHVSDFVTPAWFGIDSSPPYDEMDVLAAPFTLSIGGYVFLADCTHDCLVY